MVSSGLPGLDLAPGSEIRVGGWVGGGGGGRGWAKWKGEI